MEYNNANIQTDSLSFRDSFSYYHNQLQERKEAIEQPFAERYKQIQERIAVTSDIKQLKQLQETEQFYKSMAELLDLYNEAFAYLTRGFSQLDNTYWQTVIDGEQLQKENILLKELATNLYKREEILLYYIKQFKAQIRKAA